MTKKLFLIASTLTLLTACTLPVSEDTAREALEDEGFHNVQVTGVAFFGCSEGDTFGSNWTASRTIVNPDGSTSIREVEGVICCGWLKDCTIRH